MTLSISAVICTHNRASDLKACLESLYVFPSSSLVEVLVVDNASTDNTKAVAAAYADLMLNLRYVYEARLGLPFARNCGWQAASAEIVLYLDDDATVTEGAIDALAGIYSRKWDGELPVAVGTRVVPAFIGCEGYPHWLHPDFIPYLTQLDLGPDDRCLKNAEFLVGASFSVPRRVLGLIGGFNENLPAFGMDERWVEEQIKRQGGKLLYCGTATVRHAVTPVRLQKKWFYRRLYQEGIAARKFFGLLTPRSLVANLLSLAKHSTRMLWHFILGLFNMGAAHRQSRFRHLCAGFVSLGHIRALSGDLF